MDTSRLLSGFLAEVLQVIRPQLGRLPFREISTFNKLKFSLRRKSYECNVYPRFMSLCGTLSMNSRVRLLGQRSWDDQSQSVIMLCRRAKDECDWYMWNTRFERDSEEVPWEAHSQIWMITNDRDGVIFEQEQRAVWDAVRLWFSEAIATKEADLRDLRSFKDSQL